MYGHELLCRFPPVVTDDGGVLHCGALALMLKKQKTTRLIYNLKMTKLVSTLTVDSAWLSGIVVGDNGLC